MANLTGLKLGTTEARFPTSYAIKEISLTNHEGKQWDIQYLVTDFSITESLYTSSLMLSMNIKDPVNLMEEAKLTGHETITVKLARRPFGADNKINSEVAVSHTFYVTEYPVYAKSSNLLQVYSIRAISQYAFVSQFKRISRAFSGNISDFIYEVFERDIPGESHAIVVSDEITTNLSFVVPNMHPLDAVQWVLRRAFDHSGSPAYLYQTLSGEIRVETQAEIVKRARYNEYTHAKFFHTDPLKDPAADYKERANRILEIASDLRMSKFMAGAAGAYASRSEYLDLSTKSLSRATFNYADEFAGMVSLTPHQALSMDFKPDGSDSLAEYKDARINFVPMNSKAFAADKPSNYNSPTAAGDINRAAAYVENLDTLRHDLTLAGDFKLNCGQVIGLKLPPAFDPKAIKKNVESDTNITADDFLSGNYVVTSVVHRFDSEYFCDLIVKRDSFAAAYFTSS